jgi:hypothetical protein
MFVLENLDSILGKTVLSAFQYIVNATQCDVKQ